MQIFQYDKRALGPLDHIAVKIHKDFQESLQETLDLWMEDFQNGLVAARGYADFAGSRIEAHLNHKGATPVIRFSPIIDEGSQTKIRKAKEFFEVYTRLRELLIAELRSHLSIPAKIRPAHRTAISLYNALKLALHLFLLGKFDYLDFVSVMEDPNSEIAAQILREVGSGEVVGDAFEAGGLLYADNPGKPFLNYIRWVRSQMIKERDEAIERLPGWILESQ